MKTIFLISVISMVSLGAIETYAADSLNVSAHPVSGHLKVDSSIEGFRSTGYSGTEDWLSKEEIDNGAADYQLAVAPRRLKTGHGKYALGNKYLNPGAATVTSVDLPLRTIGTESPEDQEANLRGWYTVSVVAALLTSGVLIYLLSVNGDSSSSGIPEPPARP